MDFLPHWNLRERPFESTWNTRFFFQGQEHDEALSRLGFLVGEKTMNIGMLTGEVGCGKTLTRAVFAERLDPREYKLITTESAAFPFKDMLGGVLEKLDGNPPGSSQTKFGRFERFRRALDKLYLEGKHLVMIFDEAQEMTAATLNEMKLLTNMNAAGRNMLSIILVGQPELREMVEYLPAINQRISLRFHLQPLDLQDTRDYLKHRLMAGGHPSGELFPTESVERVFLASQGFPREINRLAKLALEFAWLKEYPLVAASAVDAVARDLERQRNPIPA